MTRFGLQTLVAADRLAGVPRRRPRGRGGRLGLGLDVGPPDGHLRAVGAADLRGLEPAVRARPADLADPARADGRGQHVPQPGPHRQAGDDPRPPLERPGGARHRWRLVRARARRLRHRVLLGPRGAARPARRGGHADAPAARRRAVQPRGPVLHVRTTRSSRRARSRHICRSSSAGRGRRRRCGPWRCGPMPGTRTGRWTRHGPTSTSSPSTAPTSDATSRRSRRR